MRKYFKELSSMEVFNIFQLFCSNSQDDIESAIEYEQREHEDKHVVNREMFDELKRRCEHDQKHASNTLNQHELSYCFRLILDLIIFE